MQNLKKFFFSKKLNIKLMDRDQLDHKIYEFSTGGKFSQAFSVLYQMKQHQIKPFFKTYQILIQKLCFQKINPQKETSELQQLVETLIELMKEDGYKIDFTIYNSLIDFHLDIGLENKSIELYHEMLSQGFEIDFRIIHSFLVYYKKKKDFKGMMKILEIFKNDNIKLPKKSINAMVSCLIEDEPLSLENFEKLKLFAKHFNLNCPENIEDLLKLY